jgi:hypothetical protein
MRAPESDLFKFAKNLRDLRSIAALRGGRNAGAQKPPGERVMRKMHENGI